MKQLGIAAFGVLLVSAFAWAEVKPNSLFSDHAVLQRDMEVPVWGTAGDGEKVTVSIAGQDVSTTAKDGTWMVRLKAMPAGGPFVMTIRGENTVKLDDVLIGDVWICSGQSNMERRLGPAGGQKNIDNWLEEAVAANYPQIRQFAVPNKIAFTPISDSKSNWVVCSPDTVPSFSAVGYFFGRDIHEAAKVPVGLVFSAWGGTAAEAWTSADTIKQLADLRTPMEQFEREAAAMRTAQDSLEQRRERWYAKNDPGSAADANWSSSDFVPTDWQAISLPAVLDESIDGVVWFGREFDVPASAVGQPADLRLGSMDDQDTVWINGVKVGATDTYKVSRKYAVPPNVLKPGRNVIAVRLLDIGGFGGWHQTGELLELATAGSGETISLGGRWMYRPSMAMRDAPPLPVRLPESDNRNTVTVLYNGMIAPLQPYAIRGVIWYQGENNAGRATQYQTLFPAMIADWRQKWGQGDFPFLYVQIAPHNGMSPEIREAQLLTLKKSANTAMVVTVDAGEPTDIHPTHKPQVGHRLALAARAMVYGEKVEYVGPMYESMAINGSVAVLRFAHVEGGMIAPGGSVQGFTIAGADGQLVPATAQIRGETVAVFADEVPEPVAVRYGWANAPEVNLFNKAGLPASPFRTDVPEK